MISNQLNSKEVKKNALNGCCKWKRENNTPSAYRLVWICFLAEAKKGVYLMADTCSLHSASIASKSHLQRLLQLKPRRRRRMRRPLLVWLLTLFAVVSFTSAGDITIKRLTFGVQLYWMPLCEIHDRNNAARSSNSESIHLFLPGIERSQQNWNKTTCFTCPSFPTRTSGRISKWDREHHTTTHSAQCVELVLQHGRRNHQFIHYFAFFRKRWSATCR